MLGRPQPQMYPPVALNQYTWVNRTHKHFIYIYMLHGEITFCLMLILDVDSYCPYLLSRENTFHLTHYLSPYLLYGETTFHLTHHLTHYLSPYLLLYGETTFNNQTTILAHNFFLIYINLHVKSGSNLTKVWWRPHHIGDIYVEQGKTMNYKVFIYKPHCENINIFGYLEGGGGFNNQTGSILVHIYPLMYINLHVKYGSNLIRTFWVKIKYKIRFFFNFFGGPQALA